MWRKECFEKNRFVEYLMYAEEWELYSRIISTGLEGISIDKCLFYGRKHSNSNTGEFFQNNPIRRSSHADAVVLVLQNLREKQLLTNSLIRYFISDSLSFKEFDLFDRILSVLKFSRIKKIKWILFYKSHFLRMPLYKIKKKINK
jgi:hypothetical protein